MRSLLQKQHRILFYSMWVLLACAQSASTELIADEAYYWVYSRFPAWGYFDHPPMIAMVIKWGYSIFQNELGVRLVCILFSTLSIIVIEKLTDKKNPIVFYLIVLGVGFLQIAGFLAVPDTPLLFFTALFFYCYREFVKNSSWKNAVLLGFVTALMLYSKYHGVLIVLFTFLSNIKLIARWQTWLAALLVIVFFSPHLLWQWENNWPSLQYHLVERVGGEFKFNNFRDFFLGQILLAGPFIGFILLPAAFLFKTKNETERALKFNLWGVYIFFLLISFNGRAEANWTIQALVPLIVLSHQYLIEKSSWIKPLRIISLVSLIFIMAGRIYLVEDIGPDNAVKNKFHNNKEWVAAIAEKTKNVPVVFFSSYQRSSLFWFYSGIPSHSHNSLRERKNNYNFWPTESNLLGKKVYLADTYNIFSYDDSIKTEKGWVGISTNTVFAGLAGIKIIPEQKSIETKANAVLTISSGIIISKPYILFLKQQPNLKTELLAGVFKGKNIIKELSTGISAYQLAASENVIVVLDLGNIPSGEYSLRFSIQSKDYPPGHNSDKIKLRIR